MPSDLIEVGRVKKDTAWIGITLQCAVICGPGSIDQAHQPNEFISEAQVQEGELFVRRLIERLSA